MHIYFRASGSVRRHCPLPLLLLPLSLVSSPACSVVLSPSLRSPSSPSPQASLSSISLSLSLCLSLSLYLSISLSLYLSISLSLSLSLCVSLSLSVSLSPSCPRPSTEKGHPYSNLFTGGPSLSLSLSLSLFLALSLCLSLSVSLSFSLFLSVSLSLCLSVSLSLSLSLSLSRSFSLSLSLCLSVSLSLSFSLFLSVSLSLSLHCSVTSPLSCLDVRALPLHDPELSSHYWLPLDSPSCPFHVSHDVLVMSLPCLSTPPSFSMHVPFFRCESVPYISRRADWLPCPLFPFHSPCTPLVFISVPFSSPLFPFHFPLLSCHVDFLFPPLISLHFLAFPLCSPARRLRFVEGHQITARYVAPRRAGGGGSGGGGLSSMTLSSLRCPTRRAMSADIYIYIYIYIYTRRDLIWLTAVCCERPGSFAFSWWKLSTSGAQLLLF